MFSQFFLNGLVAGCLYALLAVGFGWVYNTTRVFHFAHGASYALAPYICLVCMSKAGSPGIVAVPVALAASSLLGVAMEWFVYAPLARSGAAPSTLLLSSLGLYTLIINLISFLFGHEPQRLGEWLGRPYHFGSLTLSETQLIQILGVACCTIPMWWMHSHTSFGRSMRAMRDDASLLSLTGARVRLLRTGVLAAASVSAGLCGILVAVDGGFDSQSGLQAALNAAVCVIVGGIGRFAGPVLGGILLGLCQAVVLSFAPVRWANAVTFVILLVFLLFRPEGILGERRRLEEMTP
jgi:branched-chain amino acid transport system permease protein